MGDKEQRLALEKAWDGGWGAGYAYVVSEGFDDNALRNPYVEEEA